MTSTGAGQLLGQEAAQRLSRLLNLREDLLEERANATSPAVARALQVADMYLFLALGYYGYSDRLFPEQA